MMKKIATCFFVLVLLLTSTSIASAVVPLQPFDNLDSEYLSALAAIPDPYFPQQTCYLNVTLVYDQPDGTQQRISQQIAAYTIRYKIDFDIGATGRVLGGFVAEGDYPKVEKMSSDDINFRYTMNINPSRIDYPNNTSVTNLGDQYQVWISGGSYSVTYNATYHFDINNNLIETRPATITRAYYFTETKPQPN